MSAPTEYRILGHARPGERAEVGTASASVEIDASWGTAPTGAPGPADLLASAFAACLLKNLARTHDLLGFAYSSAEVEVIARRQDAPPKFVEITYTLRVATTESAHRVELMHQNLRKFGTIYNTLAAVCDVHGSVETIGD